MAKVSIIIPFFRVPLVFFQKCLDSLTSQTLSDLEFVFVDDGNDINDDSFSFIKNSANQDSRIKILHQEHNGVSAARNLGIESAQGEYITFIDADDWIDSNAIETLYKEAKSNHSPVVIFDCIGERNYETFKYQLFDKSINSLDQADYRFILESAVNTNPKHGGIVIGVCCKLYEAAFIKNNHILFHSNISLGEDRLFFLDVLSFSPKIGYCHKPFYHYRYNEASLSHTCRKDFISIIETNHQQLSNHAIISKYPDLREHFYSWMYTDIARIILTSLDQCFFSTQNNDSHGTKKKKLLELISHPISKRALLSFDKKSFEKKSILKLFCFKHKLIDLLFLLHWFQEKKNVLCH